MKTTEQYLEEQKNRAWHNLLHYSKNYAMTIPAEGMEEEYAEALRDCEIVEELIAQHSKTQSVNMKHDASGNESKNELQQCQSKKTYIVTRNDISYQGRQIWSLDLMKYIGKEVTIIDGTILFKGKEIFQIMPECLELKKAAYSSKPISMPIKLNDSFN